MNSNESAKSRGVLLFAFNSTRVDYVAIADQASRLIEHNLKLPITIVTDHNADLKFNYDQVIRTDSKTGNIRIGRNNVPYEWKNFDRYSAYKLSPYDETVLLDTDYLMLDQSILKLFDQITDYRLQYHMQTPKDLNKDSMSNNGLPMIWATVVLFKKSPVSEMFFNLIGRIQKNYTYYRTLFGARDTSYRNDFAFSMANIILNGYNSVPEKTIPWPMTTIDDTVDTIELKDDWIVVKYQDRADVIYRQNLHVMDKVYLASDRFVKLVDEVCNG